MSLGDDVPGERPRIARLHLVRDEILALGEFPPALRAGRGPRVAHAGRRARAAKRLPHPADHRVNRTHHVTVPYHRPPHVGTQLGGRLKPVAAASRSRPQSLSSACRGPAKRPRGAHLPAAPKRGAAQRPIVDRSHLPWWSDRVESAWLVHRPARTAAGLRARMPGVRAVDLDATIAALGRFHATPAVQPFGP